MELEVLGTMFSGVANAAVVVRRLPHNTMALPLFARDRLGLGPSSSAFRSNIGIFDNWASFVCTSSLVKSSVFSNTYLVLEVPVKPGAFRRFVDDRRLWGRLNLKLSVEPQPDTTGRHTSGRVSLLLMRATSRITKALKGR